jgi:hypothetical protein
MVTSNPMASPGELIVALRSGLGRANMGEQAFDWIIVYLMRYTELMRRLGLPSDAELPVETIGDETGWLIEVELGGRPHYWKASADARCIGEFDPDVNAALRLSREKDARDLALFLSAKGTIALSDVRKVKITEHAWPCSSVEPTPSRERQLSAALGQWLHDFGSTNELSQRTRILLGIPHPASEKAECALCAEGVNSFSDPTTGNRMHARNGVVTVCSAPQHTAEQVDR